MGRTHANDWCFHPCLNCTLPDCDDESKECNVKKVLSKEWRLRKAGLPKSDEFRQAYNLAYLERYGDRRNQKRRKAS